MVPQGLLLRFRCPRLPRFGSVAARILLNALRIEALRWRTRLPKGQALHLTLRGSSLTFLLGTAAFHVPLPRTGSLRSGLRAFRAVGGTCPPQRGGTRCMHYALRWPRGNAYPRSTAFRSARPPTLTFGRARTAWSALFCCTSVCLLRRFSVPGTAILAPRYARRHGRGASARIARSRVAATLFFATRPALSGTSWAWEAASRSATRSAAMCGSAWLSS